MAEAAHSMSSSAREKMLERLLVGELQKHLWKSGHYNLEVLHAETDKAGYDIVLELNGVLRHVQLKTSFIGSKTARVNIGVKLASKPAGCVIWTWFIHRLWSSIISYSSAAPPAGDFPILVTGLQDTLKPITSEKNRSALTCGF